MGIDEGGFAESKLFKALMENTADSIYFKDRQCRLIRVSRKMAADLGYSDPAEVNGRTDIDLFGKEFGERTRLDDLRVMETGEPIIGLVECNESQSGNINWTSTSKLPLRDDDGRIIGMLGITREINELKQKEMDLQFAATHDGLTSLPNRFLFFDHLSQSINLAKRYGYQLAVVYIDLDHFKSVNDQYGHSIGDQLLVQVGNLLQKHIRESDTVARIGGDEFVILVENIVNHEEVIVLVERILTEFSSRWVDAQPPVSVTASIGISIYPKDGTEATQLIKAADDAMYEAKKKRNTFKIHVAE